MSDPLPAADIPYCVFGYGSFCYVPTTKPPPHYTERVPGFLKGYVRRFAQSSSDHRGTPEHPGRVVTLIAAEDWSSFSATDEFPHEDVVWGVCYTIDPEYAEEMRKYLDHREKDGYTVQQLDIWGVVDGVEKIVVPNATCYVGRSDNPSFVGSEPIPQLARKIWESSGPSGPNKEYLYELARAVRELAPESHDSHLAALEAYVRGLDEGLGQ